jgi:hypothetical protein
MEATGNKDVTSMEMGGEKPILPGAKLPPPIGDEGTLKNVPPEIRQAWIDYMVNGFKNNEDMFKRTLKAFMRPYHLTIWLYGILFGIGIMLFVVAAVIGLRDSRSVVAIVFAGLGAGAFLSFFIRQPVQSLEENLEFITWLGVAFNTYWTRLMYIQDPKTVQQELKTADEDYRKSIEMLITKHAELRGKRPGGDLGSKEPGSGKDRGEG